MYFQTVGGALRARGDIGAGASIGLVLHDFSGGGSERIAIRLANRWAESGRRVTLVCGHAQGPLKDMVAANVAVLQPSPAIVRAPGSRGRLGRAAAAAFTVLPPDVLFLPGNFHWPVIAPFAQAFPYWRPPPVVAQISSPLDRIDRGPIRQALFDRRFRRTMRHVAAAVALDEATAAQADALAGRPFTTALPLPALDDDTPPPKRIPRTARAIVAAGRFETQKDFELAVRAFALLPQADARLTILGDGPLKPRVQALARRLGVADRVSLPGFVPDIRPWLDGARLFLLSSRWEGYGAVVIEALAAGRPVVATDCTPAVAELIAPSGRGGVAPVGDAAALAALMALELAAEPPEPQALAVRAAGFRLGPIAQAYLALFDRVLAATPAP